MASSKFLWLLIISVVIGNVPAAHAQGTNQYGGRGGYATGSGGSTGVRTGRGPLTQPIPPATSLANPRQNYYYPQTLNRPQNYGGPAVTNPPQYPFGVGP
jgi:hypothetical protein